MPSLDVGLNDKAVEDMRFLLFIGAIFCSRGVFAAPLRVEFEGRVAERLQPEADTSYGVVEAGEISGYFVLDDASDRSTSVHEVRLFSNGADLSLRPSISTAAFAIDDGYDGPGKPTVDTIHIIIGYKNFLDPEFLGTSSGFDVSPPGPGPDLPPPNPGFGFYIKLFGSKTWFGAGDEDLLGRNLSGYQSAKGWIDYQGNYQVDWSTYVSNPFTRFELTRLEIVPESRAIVLMLNGLGLTYTLQRRKF